MPSTIAWWNKTNVAIFPFETITEESHRTIETGYISEQDRIKSIDSPPCPHERIDHLSSAGASPRAPGSVQAFQRQRCRQEAMFMNPRHSCHLIVLIMRVLAGSIRMLEQKLCADGSQMHIGMVGPVDGGVKVPSQPPVDS